MMKPLLLLDHLVVLLVSPSNAILNQMNKVGHMPFASLSENRSSIHEGDASTASTFAYRCATASRLQLFNKKNTCNGTPTNKFDENASHSSSPVHDNDMSNQLAEFHNFSASLNVSVHRTSNNANGNVINSGTQPALAC